MKEPMKYIYIYRLKYGDEIRTKQIGKNTWKIFLLEPYKKVVHHSFTLSPGLISKW